MLADLNLQELPIEALYALQQAVEAELWSRETTGAMRWEVLRRTHKQDVPWAGIPGQVAMALPAAIRRAPLQKRLPYLRALVSQDWEGCFPQADNERKDFYVYAHVDPRGRGVSLTSGLRLRGEPFYIGKGTGRRAWDLKRNDGHGKRIHAIREGGFAESAMVDIIAKDLTERQALSLEAKLIYFFGSRHEARGAGCLVNLVDHVRPVFLQEMEPRVRVDETPRAVMRPTKARYQSRHAQVRWEHWQASTLNTLGLSPELRAMGYTIVIVPPVGRELFLDVLTLIDLYQWARTSQQPQTSLVEGWERWANWTERFVTYLQRRQQHQPALIPQPPFTV